MREKIIIFIIGLLLGAIISTGSIYVYTVTNGTKDNNQNMSMNGGNPPSIPDGQNGGFNGPPDMSNGGNNQDNTSTNSY